MKGLRIKCLAATVISCAAIRNGTILAANTLRPNATNASKTESQIGDSISFHLAVGSANFSLCEDREGVYCAEYMRGKYDPKRS